MVTIAILWSLSAVAGWTVGRPKGHGAAGLLLGATLGVLGVLVVAFMRPAAVPTSTAARGTHDGRSLDEWAAGNRHQRAIASATASGATAA